jgi:hypothetical protein
MRFELFVNTMDETIAALLRQIVVRAKEQVSPLPVTITGVDLIGICPFSQEEFTALKRLIQGVCIDEKESGLLYELQPSIQTEYGPVTYMQLTYPSQGSLRGFVELVTANYFETKVRLAHIYARLVEEEQYEALEIINEDTVAVYIPKELFSATLQYSMYHDA